MRMVNNKKQFIFEEIDGSHFFPMEKKDLLCNKIKDFIYQP
jgi:surfactin synthase thioesterase subunit